jgi:phosphotransferase system enzyme I (PtsI)
MKIFQGKTLCGGIAIGPIHFISKAAACLCREAADPKTELMRYKKATAEAEKQLEQLQDMARQEAGDDAADIFEVHAMLLEDDDFRDAVEKNIQEKHWEAAYAVFEAGEEIAAEFLSMDNEYFRARSADIRDVAARLVSVLQGDAKAKQVSAGIVAAEDLTPSQTVQMDRKQLLGFAICQGSASSHTAILARTMSIPALSGVPVSPAWDGKKAVLDGDAGCLILEPDEATAAQYQERADAQKKQKAGLQALVGQKNITKSGKTIEIAANVGSLADIELARENDAGGIGLFRTEFLYLNAAALPDEEQQFQVYKRALLAMQGKKVIFRTMDIGADKQVPYLNLGQEANPALGCRAIRYCLKHPDIFKTQLRALYRASAFGHLSIMYPMITACEELDAIHRLSASVQAELEQDGIPFDAEAEQGIMIETPAAAVISDQLAEKSDFFSIGTNDLTQYTLALDRQNPGLDTFYRPHHEAVLRLIRMTVENAHKAGKWVGICGELGADETLTEQFLAMGVDELSVTPSAVLKIRKVVCESK